MKTKGLSLAEAHASGRKYRRPCWGVGFYTRYNHNSEVMGNNALATDYELEPQAKLLTREEVGEVMFLQLNISTMDRERVLERLFGCEDDEDWKHGPR